MDKSLLNRATNTDDAPTPGYLYGEIARMTMQSFETCEKVMEFLVARVKKKNHNTKYKALQVIKHVCREGRGDFRREMQKHTNTIKECLQFRGPPDPLKGDEYFKRVREAAKDCLDAIFDTNMPSSGPAIKGRISGIGSAVEDQSSGGWSGKFGWGSAGAAAGGASTSSGPPPNIPPYGYGNDPHANRYNAPGLGEDNSQGYGSNRMPYGGQEPNYGGSNDASSRYGGGYGGGYGGSQGPSQSYGGPPPNRFTGISNPAFGDVRDDKSFLQGLKEKAASKFNRVETKPSFSGAPPGSQNPPDGWSYATNRGPTSGPYGGSSGSYNPEETYESRSGGWAEPADRYSDQQHQALKERAYSGPRKKGGVGGSWGAATPVRSSSKVSEDREEGRRKSGPARERELHRSDSGDSNHSADQTSNKYAQPQQSGSTAGATSDGHYERGLVSALCAPGGMRAVPPKDKIDAFVRNAVTLDADVVGPMLEERLYDSTWQVNSKALCVIEAVINAPGCDPFFEYFAEKIASIEHCGESDKAAVRDKAIKVIRMLGGNAGADDSSDRGATGKPRPRPTQREQTDLLGGFDEVPQVGQANIFEGLQQVSNSSGNETVDATATTEVAGMFGGLKLSSNEAGASGQSMPPPAPTAQPEKRPVNFDPLLEPVPVPSQAQQQQMHMMNRGMVMNPQMMAMGMPPMQGAMNPQQMMAMQLQMQQYQQMMVAQQMAMTAAAPALRPNVSPVIGSVMTPSGIAKTIQEPTSNNGFGFIKKDNKDSFSFVQDAMKNS